MFSYRTCRPEHGLNILSTNMEKEEKANVVIFLANMEKEEKANVVIFLGSLVLCVGLSSQHFQIVFSSYFTIIDNGNAQYESLVKY